MSTMLSGAAVMDSAVMLIASTEYCPQPQSREHLAAVEHMHVQNVLVVQNKIDLVRKSEVLERSVEIQKFIKDSQAILQPVIPASAQLSINIDLVAQRLVTDIPIPIRDYIAAPRLLVVRSFDINKPGSSYKNLEGGVAGGSLVCGVLKLGMEIELRPGVALENEPVGSGVGGAGKAQIGPLKVLTSRIVSLKTEENNIDFAVPGGLIGVGTEIDPAFCRSDKLVGQVLGIPGFLPRVYIAIEVEHQLLSFLVGASDETENLVTVQPIEEGEILLCNIGSNTVSGTVEKVSKGSIRLKLSKAICCNKDERVALSRKVMKTYRLIGHGTVKRGRKQP